MVKSNHTSRTKKKEEEKKKLPSSRQSFTLTKRKDQDMLVQQPSFIMQIKRHKNNMRTNLEPTDEMTKQFCYGKSS